ncbi:hypothetical protein HK097_008863 [Rhizophlyctis rosea]|uniref:Uncharacterized protein n=1 Tax=Rhizophlyctis rosea TaxID=64517 RepID=A0AAD5X1F4_9FUNG|nr:hypothetical protein HK097_008863 [Rhizophlyctis rosea]
MPNNSLQSTLPVTSIPFLSFAVLIERHTLPTTDNSPLAQVVSKLKTICERLGERAGHQALDVAFNGLELHNGEGAWSELDNIIRDSFSDDEKLTVWDIAHRFVKRATGHRAMFMEAHQAVVHFLRFYKAEEIASALKHRPSSILSSYKMSDILSPRHKCILALYSKHPFFETLRKEYKNIGGPLYNAFSQKFKSFGLTTEQESVVQSDPFKPLAAVVRPGADVIKTFTARVLELIMIKVKNPAELIMLAFWWEKVKLLDSLLQLEIPETAERSPYPFHLPFLTTVDGFAASLCSLYHLTSNTFQMQFASNDQMVNVITTRLMDHIPEFEPETLLTAIADCFHNGPSTNADGFILARHIDGVLRELLSEGIFSERSRLIACIAWLESTDGAAARDYFQQRLLTTQPRLLSPTRLHPHIRSTWSDFEFFTFITY